MTREMGAQNVAADPWVLGLGLSHNGAACLLHGDRVVAAIQEERLSRIKRHRMFGAMPSLAVRYCLDAGGIGPGELDLVVASVQGHASSADQDVTLNPQLRVSHNGIRTLTVPHHLAHAASALATAGVRKAAILVVDGMGSPYEDLTVDEQGVSEPRSGWETISLYRYSKAGFEPLEKHLVPNGAWLSSRPLGMPSFGSLGGMYSAVAQQIFGDSMDAGKVMGLAPLGCVRFPAADFFEIIGDHFVFKDTIPSLFDHNDRWPQHSAVYVDLARSVQEALDIGVMWLARRLHDRVPEPVLCYAGGVALNCPVNEHLQKASGFARIHIFPAAEDSGTAVGAAYLGLWQARRHKGVATGRRDQTGRHYSASDLVTASRVVPGVKATKTKRRKILTDAVRRICGGQLGGWFEGGSELGPRALGQRSILGDPRNAATKDILNRRVKHREAFRPFAPVIPVEFVHEWFDIDKQGDESPFMLRVWPFRREVRDRVPAVVHADGTGRVQTVRREDFPRLHELLTTFNAATGVPILLNTSFNGAAEPIVETPEDALWCLVENGLDFVIINDFMIERDSELKSLLDLIPRVIANEYEVNIPLAGGGFSSNVPDDGTLHFQVRTPWGNQRRPVSAFLSTVLNEIDGVRNGWAIAECLASASAAPVDAEWLLRVLASLRRERILHLDRGISSISVPETEGTHQSTAVTPPQGAVGQ